MKKIKSEIYITFETQKPKNHVEIPIRMNAYSKTDTLEQILARGGFEIDFWERS